MIEEQTKGTPKDEVEELNLDSVHFTTFTNELK